MARIHVDDKLRAVLRNVKEFKGLAALEAATEGRDRRVSERTLYRQAEDDPPPMSPDTRTALTIVFKEAGLLGDYDYGDLPGIIAEWKRSTQPSSDDVADHSARALEDRDSDGENRDIEGNGGAA